MFSVGAFAVQFFGGLMTFDVVTCYGLLCAGVFLTGLVVALRQDKTRRPASARVRR